MTVVEFNEGAKVSNPRDGRNGDCFERDGMSYLMSAEALMSEEELEDPEGLAEHIRQENRSGNRWPSITTSSLKTSFMRKPNY
jgi:hypothetical protein